VAQLKTKEFRLDAPPSQDTVSVDKSELRVQKFGAWRTDLIPQHSPPIASAPIYATWGPEKKGAPGHRRRGSIAGAFDPLLPSPSLEQRLVIQPAYPELAPVPHLQNGTTWNFPAKRPTTEVEDNIGRHRARTVAPDCNLALKRSSRTDSIANEITSTRNEEFQKMLELQLSSKLNEPKH